MGIIAIFSLIMGILFMILGILAVNHYRLHPEKEKALISALFPFILGIIFITCTIAGYIWIIVLLLLIISIISHIYSRYTSIKYPEMKKKQEDSREKTLEIYKKHPIRYRLLRISRYMVYIMLACAVFLGVFIVGVVLFNITF
jgi:multisubunit Na+/H+ antiporter MnhG subunit